MARPFRLVSTLKNPKKFAAIRNVYFTPVLTSSTSSDSSVKKVKILYDGECPLCVKEINLLSKLNQKKQTLDLVDVSKPNYDPSQHSGISYDKAMEVMHVIGTDGKIYTKVDAFYEMYKAVGLGWLWAWAKLPGISNVMEKAYMWFARNRLRWTGRECETGKCSVRYSEKKQ